MADMSNEKWLASLRIELLQAGRWVEITSQTADRLEESDRRLAEYRNTPTSDDSELQGELDLVVSRNRTQTNRLGAIHGVCDYMQIDNSDDPLECVQRLADALTAERAKVSELQHQLETANAANARRAEESQLEPVGWAHIAPDNGRCYFCRERRNNAYFNPADGMYEAVELASKQNTARRVYLGPAEPLEVPQ